MFAHLEAHHEALQLLLVQGEGVGLDGQHSVPAVAEHVFKLGVPGNTVCVLLLKKKR